MKNTNVYDIKNNKKIGKEFTVTIYDKKVLNIIEEVLENNLHDFSPQALTIGVTALNAATKQYAI